MFKDVTVWVDVDDRRIITWSLDGSKPVSEDTQFTIEWAYAGGNWTVTGTVTGACFYSDITKLIFNKHLDLFYRVSFQHASIVYTSEAVQTGSVLDWPDNMAARNMVRLIKLQACRNGLHGRLLKRKTWGTPCSLCIDHDTGRPVDSLCPECFGTGFQQGYYPGIALNIINSPIAMKTADTVEMYNTVKMMEGGCVAYPFIQPRDIWVEERTNNRWLIEDVAQAQMLRNYPVKYNLRLAVLPRTDVIYSDEANDIVEPSESDSEGVSWE
ncbi:MAG: hypothetical protein WC262_10105 [Bacteroidales bacterium]|jgi:hypothetical protein